MTLVQNRIVDFTSTPLSLLVFLASAVLRVHRCEPRTRP